MDEAIKKAIEEPPRCPAGGPIEWQDPFLVFLAEYGRIPPGETPETVGKLIFLPEPPKPVFLEFYAYATYSMVPPGT